MLSSDSGDASPGSDWVGFSAGSCIVLFLRSSSLLHLIACRVWNLQCLAYRGGTLFTCGHPACEPIELRVECRRKGGLTEIGRLVREHVVNSPEFFSEVFLNGLIQSRRIRPSLWTCVFVRRVRHEFLKGWTRGALG
jgi:hypothetical protein